MFTGEGEEDEEKKLPLHLRTCKTITEVRCSAIISIMNSSDSFRLIFSDLIIVHAGLYH